MKNVCVLAVCSYMFFGMITAHAERFSSSHNTFSVNIESIPHNYKSVSKPAYPKLAGVTFITDSDANRFKFDSADVRTQCMALGFAYLTDNCESGTAKALCSSVLNSAGAEKYTSGCCNRKYYLYEDSNKCSNNNTIETCTTSSGKTYYHCGCNRSLYPFSGDSDCPHGNVANMINKCTTTDANNVSVTYYATCCPASYQETCTGSHLVGNGSACYRKEGESLVAKYESCSCSAHYDTICTGGGMIDPSDYCSLNGKKFTKDTNCEGLCQQTSQTNVDAEFYNKVWHCLYKEDGATIKTPELETGLCKNGNEDYYYQTCESQGYQKSEADCFNKDIILRCPQDTSKVWCLDSKYCTGYDVVINDANYMQKARVEMCPSTDQGYRYRYIEPDCNKCWENGVYNKTKCENKDTSAKGDDNHCCRLGYVMNNSGVCVKNTCNKTEYPYNIRPLQDLGDVDICYEGNPNASTDINLKYDSYYGYNSCRNDYSQGEMWKQDDDNPRKCVCNTQIPGKELPYSSNEYANPAPGFNYGSYGNAISCTDNESSYYGYVSCYLSYRYGVGNGDNNKIPGKCFLWNCYNNDWYLNDFPYGSSVSQNNIINDYKYTTNNVCVAKYKHYETLEGVRVGDDNVADLLTPGCNNGNEQECAGCYSTSSLESYTTADGKTKYRAHGKFKMRWLRCSPPYAPNNHINLYGFYDDQSPNPEGCPVPWTDEDGKKYVYKRSGKGACYKNCYLSNTRRCYIGDIVVDDKNDNFPIGIVMGRGTNAVFVQAYHTDRVARNWFNALMYANEYYPEHSSNAELYKNHNILGKGKWKLPSGSNTDIIIQYFIRWSIAKEGSTSSALSSSAWFREFVQKDGCSYPEDYTECLLSSSTDNGCSDECRPEQARLLSSMLYFKPVTEWHVVVPTIKLSF